jgi:serine/threonine protein kinase
LNSEAGGTAPPGWDETAKSKCVFGVAAAMHYAHSRGIIHRDLRPENILLDEKYEPRVSDFVVGFLGERLLGQSWNIGSPVYIAPEIIRCNGSKYNEKANVFSYGVILFTLLADRYVLDDRLGPFVSADEFVRRVMAGARFERTDEISNFYWELITDCWSQLADDRPTFADILKRLQANRNDYAFPETRRVELEAYERATFGGGSESVGVQRNQTNIRSSRP